MSVDLQTNVPRSLAACLTSRPAPAPMALARLVTTRRASLHFRCAPTLPAAARIRCLSCQPSGDLVLGSAPEHMQPAVARLQVCKPSFCRLTLARPSSALQRLLTDKPAAPARNPGPRPPCDETYAARHGASQAALRAPRRPHISLHRTYTDMSEGQTRTSLACKLSQTGYLGLPAACSAHSRASVILAELWKRNSNTLCSRGSDSSQSSRRTPASDDVTPARSRESAGRLVCM